MSDTDLPSGRITLRTSPELHAQLAGVGAAMGLDMTALLNLMILETLPKYAARAAKQQWLAHRAIGLIGQNEVSVKDLEFLDRLDPLDLSGPSSDAGLDGVWAEEHSDSKADERSKRFGEELERQAEIANRNRAASMVRHGGRSPEEAAEEIGVEVGTVQRWLTEAAEEEQQKQTDRARTLARAGKGPAEIAKIIKIDEATVREILDKSPAATQPEKKHGKKSKGTGRG